MNWNGKNVVVTGAGGFIGSHLAEKMVTLGANTTALVHYRSDGSWGWLDQSKLKGSLEVIPGDICDQDCVSKTMSKADVVFHLAALIGIPYSYRAVASYVRTNIEGTLNVLQAAQNAGVGLVVHTSTSEVYGSAQTIPIDENHPLQAQSPYSATKISADKLAEAFHLSFKLPVATIRPFNTYGPRQSARAVIPAIIIQALSGQPIHLGNLTPTRDFNYVDDTVHGFLRTAESPEALGQVINIGSGKEISIGDLAALIIHLTETKNVQIITDSDRTRPEDSEVDRLCANNNKASEILEWSPKHTLQDGLLKTIDWIRNNFDRYRPNNYAI